MSRIGKQPVVIPDKVKVDIKNHTVLVEGPKGKVTKTFAPVVNIAVADKDTIAYIGTLNSGAAKVSIPILNAANLVMVSPANTYVGLTHAGPGTAAGEPGKYYPTGKRNYARVVAADDFQGAADATLAKQLKLSEKSATQSSLGVSGLKRCSA